MSHASEPFPLPSMGTVRIPADYSFRTWYLAKLMSCLVGIIKVSDGTMGEVMVLGEDARQYGEDVAVEFKYI